MRFIRKLSYKGAHYLSVKLNESNEVRRVYYYGLQIIIGEAVKYTLFFLIVISLGILKESIAILLFYSPIRIIAGGYHMKDYTRCLIMSFTLFIASGLVLKYKNHYMPSLLLLILSIITLMVSLYVVYRWAPQPVFPKSPSYMQKVKWLTVTLVFVLFVLNCYFIVASKHFWAQAGIFGVLLSDFALSPLSNYIFRHFDKL